jgi:hypothetical protein
MVIKNNFYLIIYIKMVFIDEIKNKLEQKVKNIDGDRKLTLSTSTINSYLNNLIRLNNDKDPVSLTFLNNVNNIKNKLKDYKPRTQKTYIASIISILRLFNKDKLINKYEDILKDIIKITNDEDTKNKKTDTQKENWIKWDEVKNKLDELKEIVFKNEKKKRISKKEYNDLLNLLILSLYVLNEPRRNMDYIDMDVIHSYDVSKHENIKNYLDLEKKRFIFNKYKYSRNKTSDKVQQRIDIDPELMKIINYYLKRNPLKDNKNDFKFLVYNDGRPFNNSSNITKILNRIFNKNISSSMLRHIYLTYKFGDEMKDMEDTANNMAHSIYQQKKYIKFD